MALNLATVETIQRFTQLTQARACISLFLLEGESHMRSGAKICCVMLALGMSAAEAEAVGYTLTGSGDITSIALQLGGVGSPFELGSPAGFSLTFSTAVADTEPRRWAFYPGAISAYEINFDGYSAAASGGYVHVGPGLFGIDATVFASDPGAFDALAVNGQEFVEARLSFSHTAGLISDDTIPLALIGDPSVWDDVSLSLTFGTSGGPRVSATMDSLSLTPAATPIPVPAGLPLLTAAVGALALAARRPRVR